MSESVASANFVWGVALDAVLDAVADGAAVVDDDGFVLARSARWPRPDRSGLPEPGIGRSFLVACAQHGHTAARFGLGLDRVLRSQLVEYTVESPDIETMPYRVCAHRIASGGALVRVDLIAIDSDEPNLVFKATHDPLTGIANRALLIERLDEAMAGRAHGEHGFGVLFCDLDRFKVINDTLGHDVGDEVLQAVADRLLAECPLAATCGRLGGDEFAVIVPGTDADVAGLASRILDAVREPVHVRGRVIPVSLSIGYAIVREEHRRPEDILRAADVALYDAKERGRDRAQAFSAEHDRRMRERAGIERDLREAYPRDELTVHYQPLVHARHGHVAGLEALIRWDRRGEGLVAPDVFIPIAEETGMIALIDRFAMFRACEDLARWQADDAHAPRMVSVNVSGRDFADPGLVDTVRGALEHAGLPAHALCIEITESTMLASGDEVLGVMHELRALGCYLAIDDFGTGYSSLSSLQHLPVEIIKIDRAFVTNVATNRTDASVVVAIVNLARALGLHVIAEGVENRAQAEALAELGCDALQGFHFARPEPAARVARTWRAPTGSLARASAADRRILAVDRAEKLFIHEFMQHMGIPLEDRR